MTTRLPFQIFLFLVFARHPAFGQKYPLLFHHLSTENGLSQSDNAHIRRDQSGFVWISSVEGLNRFDGVQVKVYQEDPKNPKSIHGGNILSPVFEDARHDLWFSTERGLNRYNRATDDFDHFTVLGDTEIHGQYNVFFLDSDGFLWVDAGPNGVVRLQTKAPPGTPTTEWQVPAGIVAAQYYFPVADARTGKLAYLYTIHPDSAGIMVYQNENGRLRLTRRLFDGSRQLPAIQPVSLLPIDDGAQLWIVTRQGLLLFNPATGSYQRYAKLRTIPLEQVNQMVEILPNLLALATSDQGLLIWNTAEDTVRVYDHHESDPLSLANNRLKNLYFDREDKILWLSSWGSGVEFTALNKTKFRTIRLPHISGDENQPLFVPAVMAYSTEGIWCASWLNRGLRLLSAGGSIRKDYSAVTGRVDDILVSSRFGTFFCSEKGVFQYLPASGRLAPVAGCDGRERPFFSNMFEAHDKSVIGSFTTGGLGKISTENGQPCVKRIQGTPLDSTWLGRMFEDQNGRGYAETGGAVLVFDGPVAEGKIHHTIKLSGLINSFCENNNYVWVGGSFGLLRIDKSTLADSIIDLPAGIPRGSIQYILPSGDEELWLSTNRGLFRYNLQNLRLDVFERYDGLQSNEFLIASGMRSPDGRLWFGGVKGINVFDPKDIGLVPTPPKIQITDILVNDMPHAFGQNVSEITSFTLPYGENKISFYFAAIEYSDPGNNRLRYQLLKDGAPYDSVWLRCADARGFARYAGLQPGQYRFLIEAESSDGVLSETRKSIDFTIEPPFYRTWWFRLLMGALLVGGLVLFYRNRVKQEQMKTRVAMYQFEVLRSALKAHFIRNMAADLQGLMATNMQKAQLYLHRFTELVTSILDNVTNRHVPIDDELELVRNYLRLSALGFPEGNLKYEVTASEDLDAPGFLIPGMLLQPFVENSLKHGLKPRDGAGLVQVRVSFEESFILCTIEDDGVGRSGKGQNAPGHKSRSIRINEERLRLYDSEQGGRSQIEIIDLKDDNERPTGTRVEIRIGLPVKHDNFLRSLRSLLRLKTE